MPTMQVRILCLQPMEIGSVGNDIALSRQKYGFDPRYLRQYSVAQNPSNKGVSLHKWAISLVGK